jgi:hypothetical protein
MGEVLLKDKFLTVSPRWGGGEGEEERGRREVWRRRVVLK